MKIKNLFNNENRTKLIGLLTILLALWLVLYFIPEVFLSLFNTLLGNLILIIATLLIYMNNRIYGLTFGLFALILYRFSRLSKDGFSVNVTGTFNIEDQKQKEEATLQELQQIFLEIQDTINRNTIFDMNVINSQSSKKELEYFNKNGQWPWSQDVINLFEEAISRNPYIRTVPAEATNYARTIYNEKAILRILSYQTKEGQFLINGVLVKDPSGNKMEELPSGFGNFPYETGLLGNRVDDIIKCNTKNEANPTLERIRYTGKGGIFGEQREKVTPVDYNKLEEIIPGFTFLNKPCNPCGAIASTPDYSCAYRLKVKDKPPFISNVWQYLWNINDNPLDSQPSFLSEYINPNKFPLLSELQTELQKQKVRI
jgi:hypothetical protein